MSPELVAPLVRGAVRRRRGRRLVDADPDEEGAARPAGVGAGGARGGRRGRARVLPLLDDAGGAPQPVERTVLRALVVQVDDAYGPVRVKLGGADGEVVGAQPEFEDCRRRAARAGVPVREVMPAAAAAAARGAAAARERDAPDVTDEATARARRSWPRSRRCWRSAPATASCKPSAEHVAHALAASSVDPGRGRRRRSVYIVADSDETETGRVRLPLAQYPHIRRAFETGEMTSTGSGFATPLAGRDRRGVSGDRRAASRSVRCWSRFPQPAGGRVPVATVRAGKLAAVDVRHGAARGARAGSDPRAHAPDHAPRLPAGAPGARHRALPRLHRQRLRRHPGARRRRARALPEPRRRGGHRLRARRPGGAAAGADRPRAVPGDAGDGRSAARSPPSPSTTSTSSW